MSTPLHSSSQVRRGLYLGFAFQVALWVWLLAGLPGAQSSTPSTPHVPSPSRMPQAVSSFGAAELDGWVYVVGGHTGRPHRYSEAAQWTGFARMAADDLTRCEELPAGTRCQGTALVAA